MGIKTKLHSVITGTGSYIPKNIISGNAFLNASFYDNGVKLEKENTEIISKFSEITEINERRYIDENQVSSNIAAIAAQNAIDDAKIDKETLDHIIFCHNFGDVKSGSNRMDILPSLAAKIKQALQMPEAEQARTSSPIKHALAILVHLSTHYQQISLR